MKARADLLGGAKTSLRSVRYEAEVCVENVSSCDGLLFGMHSTSLIPSVLSIGEKDAVCKFHCESFSLRGSRPTIKNADRYTSHSRQMSHLDPCARQGLSRQSHRYNVKKETQKRSSSGSLWIASRAGKKMNLVSVC